MSDHLRIQLEIVWQALAGMQTTLEALTNLMRTVADLGVTVPLDLEPRLWADETQPDPPEWVTEALSRAERASRGEPGEPLDGAE